MVRNAGVMRRIRAFEAEKLIKFKHLSENDHPARMDFCNRLLENHQNDVEFVSVFTNEAESTKNGVVSSHNLHIYSEENPHEI
ncbi:hypothetical protein HHI36_019832 [Cryptolaemus montrouzieri]|uniref:Uncharacterized protein n=1 Tax=Cryptolaemus montrouzieri TaxID=559131 RepID=A0ABD2N9K8_9CUCU